MWFFHLLVLIGILRIYNAKILNQCVQHVLYHLLSSDTNQIMQVEQTVYSRPLNTMQTTIRLFFLSEGARDQICTDRRKPRRPVSLLHQGSPVCWRYSPSRRHPFVVKRRLRFDICLGTTTGAIAVIDQS